VVAVHGAEIVPIHVPANAASLHGSRFLVEAEVNAAVNARVVDVVGDIPEVRVLQRDGRNRRIRERDGVSVGAEQPLGDRTSGAAA
jgi:hypothetical protein